MTGLGGALQGSLAKEKARSESLFVPPVPWRGDGGRHVGEEGTPPGTWVQRADVPKSGEGDTEKASSRMRTFEMGSLEELGGQEGTFITQRSSSAHSRGDRSQVEVCWGLCHRRGMCLTSGSQEPHTSPACSSSEGRCLPQQKARLQTN